jgi:hypothetical protein
MFGGSLVGEVFEADKIEQVGVLGFEEAYQ